MPCDHPFAIVPMALVKDASASAVCVYAVLADATNQDNNCWPSIATIALQSSMSVSTVRKSLKELTERGWVTTAARLRGNGSQSSNKYTIWRIPALDPPTDSTRGGTVDSTRGGVQNLLPPEPDPLEPDQMVLINEVLSPSVDYFKIWWEQYPKKVNKAYAKKCYANAAQKTGHQQLLDAMIRYRDEDDGVSRGYAVHASTWLNGERWLDEEVQQPVVGSEDAQWQILNQQRNQQ